MHAVFECFDNALVAIWASHSITCSGQEADKKDKLNPCVRGASKQTDMQIMKVEEISDEELHKKELNEKKDTALKETHLAMQPQLHFTYQELQHMACKVQKLHMAGVLLAECDDVTASATKLFKGSKGGQW